MFMLIPLFISLLSFSKAETLKFLGNTNESSTILSAPDSSSSLLVRNESQTPTEEDDIAYYKRLLSLSFFHGTWYSLPGNDIEGFSMQEGAVKMRSENPDVFAIWFQILDGVYIDNDVLVMLYNNTPSVARYDKDNSTIIFQATEIDYQIGRPIYTRVRDTCMVSTLLLLTNITSKQPFVPSRDVEKDLESLGVQFVVVGRNCSIEIFTSVLNNIDPIFEAQGIPYICITTAFGILKCIVCSIIIKSIEKKESVGRRISPWSLLFLDCFDLYFLLQSSYFLTNFSFLYQNILVVPYSILAFYQEPRLIIRIFQIQAKRMNDKKKARLEIKISFGLLTFFFCLLGSLMISSDFMYLLFSTFLLFQIVKNYVSCQKYQWNNWIIFGLGFPNILLIMYVKLDPLNILQLTPNFYFACGFGAAIFAQLLILKIQTEKPRFGFETPFYSVYPADRSVQSSQELCSICLEDLRESTMTRESTGKVVPRIRDMIQTPCKHEFHKECLVEWLNSKLECPYCRFELPLFEDEE